MKSFTKLFPKVLSYRNIRRAIVEASRGKRNRTDVRKWYDPLGTDKEKETIDKLIDFALHFKAPKHRVKKIIEHGKKRTIIIPTFIEQIIHHAIIQVLKECLFKKGMYEHSYACVEGRGTHAGARYISRKLKRTAKSAKIKYCDKLDIHRFYQSISQKLLIKKLKKYIRDKQLMQLIIAVIHSVPYYIGLPLGFYTSTWFANWFLQPLDHLITDNKVFCYVRYADDMTMWSSNKNHLRKVIEQIQNWLQSNKLCLKQNYQIFRFHKIIDDKDKYRVLDFMGFKFYRNRTTLRKSILYRFRHIANQIRKNGLNIFYARAMISYNGYLKHSQIYTYYIKYIRPIIEMHTAMKYVSKWERRHNGNRVQEVRKLCAA